MQSEIKNEFLNFLTLVWNWREETFYLYFNDRLKRFSFLELEKLNLFRKQKMLKKNEI